MPDKNDHEYISVLKEELSFYKERFNKRFAEGFKRGQESVKRKNKSGCCCIVDDNDNVTSVCGAHQQWKDTTNARH